MHNAFIIHALTVFLFLSVCLQLLEFDKELAGFKDRLHELDISFPPRYEHLQYD